MSPDEIRRAALEASDVDWLADVIGRLLVYPSVYMEGVPASQRPKAKEMAKGVLAAIRERAGLAQGAGDAGRVGELEAKLAEARSTAERFRQSMYAVELRLLTIQARATAAEALVARLRADRDMLTGLLFETTDRDIQWFSQNVPPGVRGEREAIDRLVRDHKKIRAALAQATDSTDSALAAPDTDKGATDA